MRHRVACGRHSARAAAAPARRTPGAAHGQRRPAAAARVACSVERPAVAAGEAAGA